MIRGLTENDVIDLVRTQVACFGGVRALAREWGVCAATISDVCRGLRRPGPKILAPLGLEREKIVVYRSKSL